MAGRLTSTFVSGLVKRNPIFVLMLGLCPTLAVTTSVRNALAMGAAASTVLLCSNVIVSLIRRFIPREIRIPCYIVVIAGFVTMVEILMKGLLPVAVNKQLGIFIPLIVVNCIIFFRAEDFASQHGVAASALDALGMGLGFTWAILLVSTIREILGSGTLLGYRVGGYPQASVMIMAPGAFIVLGLLLGYFQWRRNRAEVPPVPQPTPVRTSKDVPPAAEAEPAAETGEG